MTMTTWHVPDEVLERFAAAPRSLDSATASSTEAHLLTCGRCRGTVAAAVPTPELDATWAAIADRVDAPRPGPVERVLGVLGIRPETARLVTATPALQLGWVASVVIVTALAVVAAMFAGGLGMSAVHRLLPHEHFLKGHEGPARDLSAAIAETGVSPTPTPTSTLTSTPTPTTTSSATATPSPSPTGVAPVCQVAYRIDADWDSGFVAAVTVTNRTDQAWNGWTTAWDFGGDQRVTMLWNGRATQTGPAVQVEHASWNGVVAPGASVSFGFVGSYSITNAAPAAFTVNGVACNVVAQRDTVGAVDVAFVGAGQGDELALAGASPLHVTIPADAFAADTVAILLADGPPPVLPLLRLPVDDYDRLLLVDRAAALPVAAEQPLTLAVGGDEEGEQAMLFYRWDEADAHWGAVAFEDNDGGLAASTFSGGLFALAIVGAGVYLPLIER